MNKNFQVIKLFILHCSFITLHICSSKHYRETTDLEIFRSTSDGLYTPHSWIKTKVFFFVHVPMNYYSLPYSFLAIQEVCSVLLFFHNSCPTEYCWNRLNEVCFQLFGYGFIFSLKKWAYLTTDSSAFRVRVCFCLFFFKKKVKDWIIVIGSEKGYCLFPHSKTFYQILWGCMLFVRASLKK